jgi:hypothetical protein
MRQANNICSEGQHALLVAVTAFIVVGLNLCGTVNSVYGIFFTVLVVSTPFVD